MGSSRAHDNRFGDGNMDDCCASIDRHSSQLSGFDEWNTLRNSGAIKKV
jgi:hypothetical protein